MKTTTTILKFLLNNLLTISLVTIAFYRLSTLSSISQPKMVIFDIGQGDAILIQQDTFQILVDTGPDDALIYGLPEYISEGDRNIEIVVLTHSHDDHIQGMYTLLDSYHVGQIYYQPQCFKSKDFEYVEKNYSNILKPLISQTRIKYGDIDFEMIYPVDVGCHSDVNDDSVIAKVSIKGTTAILMGDAGYDAEDFLLANVLLGQVDILKTGHHCSRTATSDMFLSRIFPAIAICSCGEGNSFGHPHDETIEKFKNATVQYLITYQTGNIVFKFD